ncbi:General secretion pathway protein D [Rhodopirellula islandica]|uniref:General secretion pathway protein D n=1 Tax=Rhodopirellula islandica TaxID=595434 RepID=A0A0J1BGR6_RHOIS|nr:secretin N-terminal domain-containing protein [Rhodopirellula islandica]KLU05733.1 General secretion pathway protein D [Rhodopirellula islandica]
MPHDRHRTIHILLLLIISLGVTPSIAQTVEPPETISYAMRFRTAAEIERVFTPLVASSPDVRLQTDTQHDRISVAGPPWVHDLFKQVLQRVDIPRVEPAQAPQETPARWNAASNPVGSPDRSAQLLPPTQSAPANIETTRRLMPLPTGQSKLIRDELLRLFEQRLTATAEPGGLSSSGQWSLATPSGTLQIRFDLEREDVLVDGPVSVVNQFGRLLSALVDRYQRRPSSLTGQPQQRVLMLQQDVQADVQQMLRSTNPSGIVQPHTHGASANDPRSQLLYRLTGLRQVSTQVPEELPALTGEPEETNGAPNRAAPPRTASPSLPQLEGVEVQTLPDLDAIILRGRDQDLDQLAEIIRELEQLSRQTQPAIEVLHLEHTDSQSIADLIEQTQESLLGTRQGRATVTPLGKPNAILLLGWGDAVAALKDLIRKLDQPVPPESQFNLFRLKYASAASVQETVRTFFANRPGGLATTIQSTIDSRTNSLIIHAAPRDMLEVARLVERLDTLEGGTVQRTRVFEIQNSLAADVAETLRETISTAGSSARPSAMELMLDDRGRGEAIMSGLLDNVQITVDARKNNLIVSSPAENFEVIEALIEKLDSPGMVAKIKIFPIQNGDAASLILTLRSLLPSQVGADPVTSAQLSSSPGESSLAPLRFTVDVRSNSIIATGSDGDLKIVDALLLRLDEADAMQRQNIVYQLKNSPAVDVALAINEFLRNTRQVENASPATLNPFAQLEKEVVVVPEPVSNKLIVSATPRYFTEIRTMIEKLDEQPPQVMIQVLIAEVALNNTDEFGVELGIQDSVLFDRSLLGDLLTVTSTTNVTSPGGAVTSTTQDSVVSATNDPGFNFNSVDPLGNSGSAQAVSSAANVAGQGLSNFSLGRSNAELGFGGLVLSASSQNVSALLRALEESRRLEVLSRPQILTLDNQSAFIQVGQRVPRITGSTITQIGQQNTITMENVGLILGVTPRISPEGNVTMEIDAEKSEVGPESEGIPVSATADGTVVRSPRVNVASAQATVSAADGETIVLGGLISTKKKEHHRKVPYLGDIPLVKHLFRYDSVTNTRAELLIILTPHIVRSEADMERLKQTEMARMSWCACDVFNLHGEIIGEPVMDSLFSNSHQDEGIEVIYPHEDPRGQRVLEAPVLESEFPSDPELLPEPESLGTPDGFSPGLPSESTGSGFRGSL